MNLKFKYKNTLKAVTSLIANAVVIKFFIFLKLKFLTFKYGPFIALHSSGFCV